MSEASTERRLAAIVAIDVVGYSRLMGADEEGTLAALKAHQEALTPMAQEHGGRLVSTAGDGLLLEFPSVVEALNCSIKIQAVMEERNAGIADDNKMLFRIGINLGDIIIHTDNDVFGDGVNVAARIEQLAPAGGICISRSVRNQVRDRMDVNLEDMGEVEVKNIARPIRVFRVLQEGEVASKPPRITLKWRKYAAVAAIFIAVIGGGIGLWWQAQPDFEPADPARMAFKLPEKPSIAVLPFDNLTGDKEQDYLGDGLTENIIAVLVSSPDLFVIARNSSFTYKGKATKVQQVAEELGVRYVLQGSVQKSDDKIRVTAKLVDALNGKHLWAERYDRTEDDFLKVQDDIASLILVSLHANLTRMNSVKISEQFGEIDDFQKYVTAIRHMQNWEPDSVLKAEKAFAELLKKHPNLSLANNMMGWAIWTKVFRGLSKEPKRDLARAERFARKAISLDENAGSPKLLLAWLQIRQEKYDVAIANAREAVELEPGNANDLALASWVLITSGDPVEGVQLVKRAIRLHPHYPPWYTANLGFGLKMAGRYKEAKDLSEAQLASSDFPSFFKAQALQRLSAIAVYENDIDLAKQYAKRAIELEPNVNILSSARAIGFIKDKAYLEKYHNALRKAGYPEYPPGKEP